MVERKESLKLSLKETALIKRQSFPDQGRSRRVLPLNGARSRPQRLYRHEIAKGDRKKEEGNKSLGSEECPQRQDEDYFYLAENLRQRDTDFEYEAGKHAVRISIDNKLPLLNQQNPTAIPAGISSSSIQQSPNRPRASVAAKIKSKLRPQGKDKESQPSKSERDSANAFLAENASHVLRDLYGSSDSKSSGGARSFLGGKRRELCDILAELKIRAISPTSQTDLQDQNLSSLSIPEVNVAEASDTPGQLQNLLEASRRTPHHGPFAHTTGTSNTAKADYILAQRDSKARTVRRSLSSKFLKMQNRSLSLDLKEQSSQPRTHAQQGLHSSGLVGSQRILQCNLVDDDVSDVMDYRSGIEGLRDRTRVTLHMPPIGTPKNTRGGVMTDISDLGSSVTTKVPLSPSNSSLFGISEGDSNPRPSTGGQLRSIESQLFECEERIESLLKRSEQQDSFLNIEFPRIVHVLDTLDRAQEIRYRSLLDVFADNFRTMGQVEARFEQLLSTQRE
jgi:hypothetical protein